MARTYSPEQRAVIAAMLDVIDLLMESYTNKPDERLGALIALQGEVLANILRGERGVRLASLSEIQDFAQEWDLSQRAPFNSKSSRTRASRKTVT